MPVTRRAAAAGLLTAALPARAQAPIPFAIGMSAPANTFLAIWMAIDAGLYQNAGLAPQIVPMTGGSDAGPALSQGRIQAMHIGLSSVIRANNQGASLRAIGSLSNVVRFTLFAKRGITSPEQLKGGIFGISSAGSESDVTITLALAKAGLDRSYVKTVETGSGGQRLAALRAGVIAAAALNEPFRTQALEEGLPVIADLVPDQTPWVFSGLVADAAYIGSNRGALLRFLRATVEGNYIAMADAARGKAVLGAAIKTAPGKILDIVYDDFRRQSPPDAQISLEGARRNIEFAASPRDSRDVGDFCDFSLFEELRGEGFFAAMRAKYGAPAALTAPN